jgi:putative ABC transport system permease protein
MIVFQIIFGILALLVALSVLASLTAVVYAFLPVAKVPLRYNLRNLQVRWKTSLVTALAFTLVVSILVVMLAFVKGMDRLTESSGHPGNVLVLSDGATDEAFSSLPGSESVYSLPFDVQKLIAQDENGKYLATKEVYVILTHNLPTPEPGGRKRRFVQMRGLDDPEVAAQVHGIELEPGGTWWSPSGVRKIRREVDGQGIDDTAYEVVLGHGLARTFGQDKKQGPVGPGEVLQIGPRNWYVVGVMKPDGSTFGSEIWTRDEFVKKNFGRENSYSSFTVRLQDPELVQEAARLLKKLAVASFEAVPEREYYAKLNQTNQQFLVAIIFVAIILAIGGVLGVMNTMFAAISQRTKDIGVLRLLGFTRWQILMSFLLESLLIALVGGLLGCALSYLTDGWTASSIVSSSGGGGKSVVLKLEVGPTLLGFAMLFALLMGSVGGVIPSLSAMRLKPLESLR